MFEVTAGNAGHQYIGTNSIGSTEFYQNWGEAYNFAWDARGDDGSQKDGAGSPNSSVVLSNLAIPQTSQMSLAKSLV